MKIIFAINSNGLGHATRCIPLISECIKKGMKVYIISNYRAMDFLKDEFKNTVEKYFILPDYSFSKKVFGKKKVSVEKFLMYLPMYLNEFRNEHKKFKKIQKKYTFDIIISDARPGIYDSEVPSYLINHHIKIPLQGFLKSSKYITEFAFFALKNKYKKILIPDFETNSLAGEYTHDFNYLNEEDYEYLGLISMINKKQNKKKDIDYFFSISGPEPQRTVFEKKIMTNIKKIQGKIVITLGKPEKYFKKKEGNVEIYSFLDKKKQSEMMSRAKLVITRSGYTTLMDLAQIGQKALLIPTKGQPEQEYLAKYHLKQGNYYFSELDDLNIPKDLEIAERFLGYKTKKKTKDATKKFMDIILKK
ncbi:hypothetical protein HOD20_02540 [archaeon]|nr:hypothetical protein [archaeon]MBT4351384.1 hypothetical protein [archaeon]MBT4646869.1 hypothetical protein [archaeon]MBT6822114.1 hypothetical protein [archaeon]MBT7392603.1 hypothetical protein [archaeon]